MSNASAPTLDAWALIAPQCLKLAQHVGLNSHRYRGRNWCVIHDRISTRYFRIDHRGHEFLRRLDGTRTVASIVDELNLELPESPVDHDSVVTLIARLHAAELIQGEQNIDPSVLHERRGALRNSRARAFWLRPLSLRFPLIDPDRLLNRIAPWFQPLFSRPAAVIWAITVASAVIIALSHWGSLTSHWSSRALDPQNLLAMMLVYPVVKLCHELGHGLATKTYGGDVHEAGVMLLVLVPIPYVDASASCIFEDKWQRMAVSAAGIIVELFLAALGCLVWFNTEPGLVNDMAFNVLFLGSASTLLFNGNPLLRFDGYYVLTDALEIPNLGQRSTHYLRYLLNRYLFGLRDAISPVTAKGECAWFVVYGIAATSYRIVIAFSIALYIAGKYFFVGALLALWCLASMIALPLWKGVTYLLGSPALVGHRLRALSLSGIVTGTAAVFIFLIPMPSWTQAEGVLIPQEHSEVSARLDGFVTEVLVSGNQLVHKGDTLIELSEPLLPARISIASWRLKEYQARERAEFMRDRVQRGIYGEEIARIEAERMGLNEESSRQTVTSPASGVFVPTLTTGLQGRFVKKGTVLGYIADPEQARARIVIPQQALNSVRNDTLSVELRYPHHPEAGLPATILNEIPLVGSRLPSRLLGTQGGGAITVDARDGQGTRTLEPVYQLDISAPLTGDIPRLGSRIYVRFNHRVEPLASQWSHWLRQLLIDRLAV